MLWPSPRLAGSELRKLNGHVPRIVASLRPVESLESTRRLDLAIGLPLRNRDALNRLISELYDPASPNYHHYLTPRQFAERFGPTPADYEALVGFANSNHLVLTRTYANRMLLDVNGAVADIQSAFHVRMRLYKHPREPRLFYSPDAEPSIDPRLPVLSIAGLDDYSAPRPMDLKIQPAGAGPLPAILDATGSGPSGTFLGADFRAAYAPGVALDGTGESIGLLEFDNYYPSDITQYEALAGLPAVPLTNVLVKGFNRAPGSNNGEVALDIQMAISMAPGVSRILVYQGSLGNDILNQMATDNQARQLSSSWNFGQAVDPIRDQIFQEFAAQGQSFFQSSGDAGAYAAGAPAPADDAYITIVGGTSLRTISPGGSWASESAWPGGGGGVSVNYAIPVWQQAINMTANSGSATMRNVPDVAALADAAIWVVANNGEQGTASGTSASAPLWAGFTALVNQQAAVNGQPPVGFINPSIYAIGQGPAYANALHDITTGNNTNSGSPARFFAVPGYDLCTGWGSPGGSNLVNALLAPPDSLRLSLATNVVVTGPFGGPFNPPLPALFLTNAGEIPLSWSLGTSAGWLNASPIAGQLSQGGPAATISLLLNPGATNLIPGAYPADLWFTNLTDGFFQHRQLTLEVVTPPAITSQPVGQSLPMGATAQFAVQAATNALLSYQWRVHGTNLVDDTRISGSTTPSLLITSIATNDGGTYSVLVSNAAGSASSSGALLSVTSSAPILVQQPLGQTLLPGANARFTAVVWGSSPLSLQWRRDGTNLADAGNVSGSASNALLLSQISAADAGAYSVIVSNALGAQASVEAPLTVASLTAPGLVQAPVHGFSGGTDGGHPNGLLEGTDGQIYGTTATGGADHAGTVFQLSSDGQPQPLHAFAGIADGERPNGGLVQLFGTSLFGTTYSGGSNAFGTIFKLSTNGAFTTLFTLDHTNGVLPTAGLTTGPDGALYGTAYEGGIFHYGTVFRVDTNGGFSTVLAFNGTNGAFPHAGLLLGRDGSFYGTTYKGGAFGNGTVFQLSPGGALSTLFAFNGTNGAFPIAGLSQGTDGSLYGSTAYGGAFGLGTLFRITLAGSFTTLASFSGLADGSHPGADLMQSRDGNSYGTTSDGGSFDSGTVFRLSPEGALSTIAELDGFTGANPQARLLEAPDGSIYGAAANGGPDNQGMVFRLTIPASPPQITEQPSGVVAYAGSTVTLAVASFGSSPLSYQWQKNLTNLADGGRLFGAQNRVLSITNISSADAGSYAVTVSNAFGSAAGSPAVVQVVTSAPFFTTQPNNQTLPPGSTLVLRASVLGDQPLAYQWQAWGTNLVDTGNASGASTDTLTVTNATQANNGNYTLVVTNALGSATSSVAVISVVPISAPGTSLQTLYYFAGKADGRNPNQLVDGLDGYLYGTAQFGGAFSDGTLFRIGTAGGFTSLFSFNQTNGAFPSTALARVTNGLFYGSTASGGLFGLGTLFAVSNTGALTTLHSFSGNADGGAPATALVAGADGNLYGSTSEGGAAGLGTLFRSSPLGTVTTLHSFAGSFEGNSAAGPLLQMPDGSFYGLTGSGGSFTNGSMFKMSPTGTFTCLYSFTGQADGYDPVGALILGDDGDLYGATRYNTIRGFPFYGTLFKVNTNGALSTLYALNFTDGSYPGAGLILSDDGNFYGTTEQGGGSGFGTVFRMTPTGVVSTLVEFDGFDDGAYPLAALTVGVDGALYGTTSTGGPADAGTVFRMSFTGPPQITAQPAAQTGFTGGSARFSVAVAGGRPLSFQWQKNGTNLLNGPNLRGTNARLLSLGDLALADAGTYTVIITNGSGSVTSVGAILKISISPPRLQATLQGNGTLLLGWNTVAGQVYQVQFKSNLSSGNWINAGPALTATGASLASSVVPGPDVQQFYRVILLP